jgi:hypothetical protein
MARDCFVVMGYGLRTDPDTSKVYNLDKTYKNIIEASVREAGFQPIRSDEVTQSGHISRQMYRYLMDADLVVCDLTTLNPNALYELGVRMAMRPRATVVIAAKATKIPFNLNQNRFFMFEHGGDLIDYDEVVRFRAELTTACRAAAEAKEPDSLIYAIFENSLEPPRWRAEQANLPGAAPAPADNTLLELKTFVTKAKADKRWDDVIEKMKAVHAAPDSPVEPWFTQQWALATYKRSEKDGNSALNDLLAARDILQRLSPAGSVDPETLGLWAAVHRRLALHERGADVQRRDLSTAITSYRKGFVLRDDHYNGVNYAFLLLHRALKLPAADERYNARDFVEATEAWQHVIANCKSLLDSEVPGLDAPLSPERREQLENDFWAISSVAQSLLATRDARYTEARELLVRMDVVLKQKWMLESADKQERDMKAMMDLPGFHSLSAPLRATTAPAGQP